ncbi:OGFr-N domain-containing protein [Mycena kentingensis (nom. inval.)]|nr:OGFr-N domain-containing protein [Mycena kentingensis (nom. inval.)]
MTSIPGDVLEFLRGYPRGGNSPNSKANAEFYSNTHRCQPDNLLVEEIHTRWAGDYNKLERKHGFIQWLFPIREHGMNYESQPLQPHEIDTIKGDPDALKRLLASYRLMLDFYGMRLLSEETGALDRSEGYESRYENLVYSGHNYLRISRILKCLSEFGFERLNAGFLLHVLVEQSENGQLKARQLCSSMDRWWANCIRNDEEREWIGGIIKEVRKDGEFMFTREMYLDALERRKATGSFRDENTKVEG